MSPKIHAHAAAILAVNLVVTVAVSRPALAADASAWDGDQRAAVRLIAGAQRGAVHRAGIEIRLAPGWKTYWRYPGDSGIPPRFDFSSSKNVKSVTVRYPAPHRLTDESGTSIGYKDGVVFPLDVVPQNAAQPVALVLKADYAICEKICIPAEGKAELSVTGKPGAQDGWLKQNEALVPVGGEDRRRRAARGACGEARGQAHLRRCRGARRDRAVRRGPGGGLGAAGPGAGRRARLRASSASRSNWTGCRPIPGPTARP